MWLSRALNNLSASRVNTLLIQTSHLVLLSEFYEAYLDYIIIGFLQEKLQNCRLKLDMKARLLFVVLCGNLDLDPKRRRWTRRCWTCLATRSKASAQHGRTAMRTQAMKPEILARHGLMSKISFMNSEPTVMECVIVDDIQYRIRSLTLLALLL